MFKAIQARLAAIIASFVIATLASHGIGDLPPDARGQIEQWVSHTFDLMLFLGYALLHPWIQHKLTALEARELKASTPNNPVGTTTAASVRDEK